MVKSAIWGQSLVLVSNRQHFRVSFSWTCPPTALSLWYFYYSVKASVPVLLMTTLDLLGRTLHFWGSVSRTEHHLGSRAWGSFHFPSSSSLRWVLSGRPGGSSPSSSPRASALRRLRSGALGGEKKTRQEEQGDGATPSPTCAGNHGQGMALPLISVINTHVTETLYNPKH